MAALTICNLPDDLHRALIARAAEQGRSLEAEVLDILESAIKPATRLKLIGAFSAGTSDRHHEPGLRRPRPSLYQDTQAA